MEILDNFQPSIPYLLNFQSFRLIEISNFACERPFVSMPLAFTTSFEVRFIESHHGLQTATGTFILLHAHVRHAVRKHAAGFYGEDSKRDR